MDTIVANKIPQLAELCRKYSVVRMYLFGSAARGDDFDPAMSDFDFLISFSEELDVLDRGENFLDLIEYLQTLFGRDIDLIEDLQTLFGRDVDLMTEKSLSNPYLIASIDKDKKLIYEKAA